MSSFIPSFRDFVNADSLNITPNKIVNTTNDPLENVNIPVVYGLQRITPPRIYTRISDEDPNTIVCVYALSQGECLGIYRLFVDNVYVQTSTVMTIDETNIPANSTNRTIVNPVSTSVYNGVAQFEFLFGNEYELYIDYTGSIARIDGYESKLLTQHVRNASDRLEYKDDLCLLVATFTYTGEESPYRDIPQISVDLFGRRIRDNGVNPDRYLYRKYSTNPVECLFDYMTNSNYGLGINDTVFDQFATGTSWDDARDYCEKNEQSTLENGSVVNNVRYTINKVLDTSVDKSVNVTQILQTYMFIMPWIEGKFYLFVESRGNAEITINEDSMIDSFRITYPESNTRFNSITYTYIDPSIGFGNVTRTYPTATSTEYATYLSEDNGVPRNSQLTLNGITNPLMAERIAKSYLLKSRLQAKYEFTVVKDFFKYRVGDIVNFSSDMPDITLEAVRIVKMTLQDDDTIAVEAYSHNDAFYTPFPDFVNQEPTITQPLIPGSGGVVQPGDGDIGINPPTPGDENPDDDGVTPAPIVPDPSPEPTPIPDYTFNLKSGETLPTVGGSFDPYPQRFYIGSIKPDQSADNPERNYQVERSIADTDYVPDDFYWLTKNCPTHTRFVNGAYTLNLTIVDRTAPTRDRLAMVYELSNGKYGICRKFSNTVTPTNYVWDPEQGTDTVDVINEIAGNTQISYTEWKNLNYFLELENDNTTYQGAIAYNKTGFYNFPLGSFPIIYPRGANFNRTHQNRFRDLTIRHLLTPTFAPRENFVRDATNFTFNFKLYNPGTKEYYGSGSVVMGPNEIPTQGFVDILGASQSEYYNATSENYPFIPF